MRCMEGPRGLWFVLTFFVFASIAFQHSVGQHVHDCFPSVDEGDNTTDLGKILVSETPTDSPITDIQWVQDPFISDTMKESVFVRTMRGTIYRSTDLGKTWHDIMDQLQGSKDVIDGNAGVSRMYTTRSNIVFVGYGSNMWSWTSANGFKKMNTHGLRLTRIRMHPFEPGWILAATGSKRCYDVNAGGYCYGILYVTKDHGQTWTSILDYVADYSWGNPGQAESENTVYAITWDDKTGNQNQKDYWDSKLRKTQDFFKSTNQLILDHCVGFIFTEHRTLWAITPVKRHDSTLRLFTSTDGGRTIAEAQFPVSPDVLQQGSYTILDTREGMSFINVEHGTWAWGHTYGSDATDRKYSLSLEYNARMPFGAVDFERLEGIDGVYVANYLSDEGRGASSTVISTDKGAEWYHLHGASAECQADKNCHLHLFGYTSGHPQFYSMASAIGLMIGLGNEGPHLKSSPIDTYVSRDAGLTWSLARKGSHIYEYGDHGGIIVMAKNLESTSEIVFSWNEGDTWHPCHFSDLPVRIYNIMSGAGPLYGSSQQFVAYGKRGDVDILLHFDFSELHERKCEGSAFPDVPGSDYELWVPGRKSGVGQCILGKHTSFVRRKPSAQCVNGAFYSRGAITTHCPCTREDFTCDYCYEIPEKELDNPNEHCVLSEACKAAGYDPKTPPNDCNGTYPITRGYRLVVGDECVLKAGDPHMPTLGTCPDRGDPVNNSGGGVPIIWVVAGIASILAILAVVGAVIFFAVKVVRGRGFRVITPVGPSFETNDEEEL